MSDDEKRGISYHFETIWYERIKVGEQSGKPITKDYEFADQHRYRDRETALRIHKSACEGNWKRPHMFRCSVTELRKVKPYSGGSDTIRRGRNIPDD